MISIDGYGDLEQIGQGGLGDVYRARRDSTGATVAIKVLRDVSDESVAWHRTRRELTALVSLAGHANVVQLLEMLDLPEGPALVMEYAPGGSIAELMLRRDEPLSVGETVLVGRQTAAALTAAHAQGIVHRDVKPQNLLIDAYGQVKLCDFGIAAVARSEEFQVRTSAISMRYASPEDLDDEVDVGPASDVYSLGATMLHMARGAPPTLKERLAPWVPPQTDDSELAALDRIMAACLHPVAEQRPSAADVADDLERLGWSIDERNRAIPFESAGPTPHDDAPTDVRSAVAETPSSRPPSQAAGPPVGGERDDADDAGDVDEIDDDATLYRDDRARPRPDRTPPPEPATGRRWPIAIAIIAGLAAVVAVGLAITGGDDPDDVDGTEDEVSTLSTVARPDGLSPLAELDWPGGAVGECLVQTGDTLAAVDCGEPHDLQRIGGGTLDELGEAFEPTEVQAAVRSACEADAVAIGVGTLDGTALDRPFSAPSASTWADGDRAYVCFVGVADRRLVGDAVMSTG